MTAVAQKKQKTYIPPLFERISANAPEFYDEKELKESIAQEVALILNARLGTVVPEEEESYPPMEALLLKLVNKRLSVMTKEKDTLKSKLMMLTYMCQINGVKVQLNLLLTM